LGFVGSHQGTHRSQRFWWSVTDDQLASVFR
jgi:hypothetical protein